LGSGGAFGDAGALFDRRRLDFTLKDDNECVEGALGRHAKNGKLAAYVEYQAVMSSELTEASILRDIDP